MFMNNDNAVKNIRMIYVYVKIETLENMQSFNPLFA